MDQVKSFFLVHCRLINVCKRFEISILKKSVVFALNYRVPVVQPKKIVNKALIPIIHREPLLELVKSSVVEREVHLEPFTMHEDIENVRLLKDHLMHTFGLKRQWCLMTSTVKNITLT